MRSISLIVVGILAYVATANPICSGDDRCYLRTDPCPVIYCEPKAFNPQCVNPKCKSECDERHICIYERNATTEDCGEPICFLNANNQM
ncbi:hypothetical protein BDF22DRAFT_692730 [Syncephalis plumigaleata]|nr:hypothetical protein BDF22DRAFT_692730 [Syncephalis plumigaleata]